MATPPICDYEGSDYQQSFWDQGGREYEDRAEALALKRLLPASGDWLLELGAGAGRNTPRYKSFKRIVLVDYSSSQLLQARKKLGVSDRHLFVVADAYHLPFPADRFDAATMIRTLHHLSEPPRALAELRSVLRPDGLFILEFANKRNLKSIFRYLFGLQSWNPFTLDPVEFARLNFDFHPKTVFAWLNQAGFVMERVLAVSHFRIGILKKIIPARLLASLDSFLQPIGKFWQFTPSLFVRARLAKSK